jgi:hypothetical protein
MKSAIERMEQDLAPLSEENSISFLGHLVNNGLKSVEVDFGFIGTKNNKDKE